jgi:hypothetical protein
MKNNYLSKCLFLFLFGITSSTLFAQDTSTKEKQSIEKTTSHVESKEVKTITFSPEVQKQHEISLVQNFIDYRLSQGDSKSTLKKHYEQLEKLKVINPVDNR